MSLYYPVLMSDGAVVLGAVKADYVISKTLNDINFHHNTTLLRCVHYR